jgi:hypothetical protein
MNQVKQDTTVTLRGGGALRCVYIIIVVAAIEVDDSECTGLCHSSLLDIYYTLCTDNFEIVTWSMPERAMVHCKIFTVFST